MSTIKVDKITGRTGSAGASSPLQFNGDTLTLGTINSGVSLASATLTGTTTLTGDLVPSSPLSHRNLIINGAMQVSQRGTTTAPTPKGADDDGYFSVDRYRLKSGGTTPARFNLMQESITDLAGFSKAMKVDCTTASASPGSDDYVILTQRMEGFDLQQMEKGFSSAKPVTLSFWVKGTASRTYVVELRDTSSTARSASQQFTVTASWVKHTYTFPGDTGGDKIPNDNTFGLEVNFWLHAGTNFSSGTYTALTWANHVDANTAVGISDSGAGVMNTTSDEFLFTGVQLELGSNATPFEHRSYGDELARCLRYYNAPVGGGIRAVGSSYGTTGFAFSYSIGTRMRDTPTLVHINSAAHRAYHSGGYSSSTTNFTISNMKGDIVQINAPGHSGLTDNRPYTLGMTASYEIALSSEL
tara:strand:- start:1613 stop:2854 length:1242 start_codon:yes stop_codon:yes gene_type:complete